MSYHEKLWKANVYIIIAVLLIIGILRILNVPDRVIMASFGLMGLIAIPSLIYGKHLKEEKDEMIKEIERRAMAASFRIVWLILFSIIFGLYITTPSNSDTITISVLALQFVLWGSFALIILINSLTGLYYLKKGVGVED